MADNTTSAPVPTAADASIQTWTCNGKPVTVQTGEIKGGNDKGKPLFRFLTAGEKGKAPSLAQVIALLATLGISEDVAPIIDREIINDLAREVSAKIRSVDGNGVWRLNDGILAKSVKDVIAEYVEQKAGKDALRTELAALSVRQSELMQKLTLAIASGKDLRTDEFKPLTYEATQVAVKISDLNQKLAKSAAKSAKKAAAPAAAAPAPAVAK